MILRPLTAPLLFAFTLGAASACGGPGDSAPEPGPAPDGEPSISISPQTGASGTPVEVSAAGFPPNSEVLIGIGPPESEYEEVQRETTGPDGRVVATANVPDWVENGRSYVWVVADPVDADPRAISDPFTVVAAGQGGNGSTTVSGQITDEGVECPALRTLEGDLYTLAGAPDWIEVGSNVRVTGQVAEVSICQQGTTINVQEVEEG